MELVYLWVEEYKNIEEQGFNFSPKFKCDYNPNTKKLTIKKQNDYIENFFGNNINITAIIGKNGSGKSSIIDLILKSLEEDSDISYILVYKDGNEDLKYMTNISIKTTIDNSEELKKIQNIFVYNKNNHANYISRKYNVMEIHKKAIVNILSVEYGKLSSLFKISTFMYLPIKIKIKLREFSEIINESINLVSLQDREGVKEKFLSLDDKYHQFLFISYIQEKEVGIDKDILLDKEKLNQEVGNHINETDFNKYFLSHITEKLYDIKKLEEQKKDIYLRENGYFHFFDFDMIDEKDRHFNHLSHGEQMLFGQLLNFYFFSNSPKETLIFLLDEPEVALHPNWQKQYINEVITLCQKIGKKYHFLLSSHSPFLLSDIPKQNIIFLDTDDDGKCKVVDGLNEKKETFGANIHTLLSDSFFMEDGFMGEFAKVKIDKAISILNQKHLSQKDIKYCEEIISIVGEPIIKRQLGKMLHQKKVDYLAEDTRKEIEFLKLRIDLLSKRL